MTEMMYLPGMVLLTKRQIGLAIYTSSSKNFFLSHLGHLLGDSEPSQLIRNQSRAFLQEQTSESRYEEEVHLDLQHVKAMKTA